MLLWTAGGEPPSTHVLHGAARTPLVVAFNRCSLCASLRPESIDATRAIGSALPGATIHPHRWFSGRMLACHAGGPGSIPGRCKSFCYRCER